MGLLVGLVLSLVDLCASFIGLVLGFACGVPVDLTRAFLRRK